MKILFITPYYKPYFGGIERVIEKLFSQFEDKGHECAILTTKWIFPSSPREPRVYLNELADHEKLISGETMFRLDSFPKKAPPFYQVPLVWFSPLAIKKIIDDFDPDAIQLMNDRWFWGNLWAWFWGRKKHVAFSLSFHELEFGQKSNPILWILKQFLRVVNGFLTRKVIWVQLITEHERKKVQTTYKTPQHKLRKIAWGVDLPTPRPDIRSDISKNEYRLLAVGRISEHKGQEWLVNIVKETSEIAKKNLVLTLVGRDEGLGDAIKKLFPDTERFKLVITGEISDLDLEKQYQNADLFVLFPEYEAFGLVFLEAMSYGVPVVTHKVGAIGEILTKGALLTEPFHEAQAKIVLTKLLSDDAFRIALAKEAQNYVYENFSWEHTADQFLVEYQTSDV